MIRAALLALVVLFSVGNRGAGAQGYPGRNPAVEAGSRQAYQAILRSRAQQAQAYEEAQRQRTAELAQKKVIVKSKNKPKLVPSAAPPNQDRAAALLASAQATEKRGMKLAAGNIYRQIAKDFPGTPAGKTAAEKAKVLGKR